MTEQQNCILLVEDDPDDQAIFMHAIHDLPSSKRCFAASNGQEALLALLGGEFRPDIIITDLNMPKMNGLELLRNLRSTEQFRRIPVIVFSTYFSEDQIQDLKSLGATAYYTKTRPEILKEILNKHFSDQERTRTVL